MNTENFLVVGDPLENAVEQMRNLIAPTADHVALMADHHLGYSMPIGGVAAYRNKVSPSGVGFDVACGNRAVELDLPYTAIENHMPEIMDEVWAKISFGMGRKNSETVESPVLNRQGDHSEAWDIVSEISKDIGKGYHGLHQMASEQLGTVGGGNHYVDIFEDVYGTVWVGCHFGSRGLGHKITTWFLKQGGGKDAINAEPVLFDADGELGQKYIKCMKLAGAYAYAGRDWVCDKVAKILSADITDSVHNHHNFAWREEHFGEEFWVIRKGATPAFPGQRGFVGSNMTDISVILEGKDSDMSKKTLYSTIHGAGRLLSRTEAKGKINRKTGEVKRPGKVTETQMLDRVRQAKVELRGGGVDESPHCYKSLVSVLMHHDPTVTIKNELRPVGVAMAAPGEKDPYKD